MNTYKIIFTRENGTQGTDHFAAINERQARKDFGECYRHSTATIVSIELASTNTPATKQQERDTLEKIRKMVEQLGPDSYLATAFEGCFDLAAENIDNDWACSMADRARNAEKRVAELEDKGNTDLTAITEAMKEFQRTSQNAFNEWFATVQGLLDEDVAGRLINKTSDLDERLTALEYMIIHNDLFTHIVDDDGNPILDDDGNAIIGDWKYKTA